MERITDHYSIPRPESIHRPRASGIKGKLGNTSMNIEVTQMYAGNLLPCHG